MLNMTTEAQYDTFCHSERSEESNTMFVQQRTIFYTTLDKRSDFPIKSEQAVRTNVPTNRDRLPLDCPDISGQAFASLTMTYVKMFRRLVPTCQEAQHDNGSST